MGLFLLNEDELNEQVTTIRYFLEKIHPELTSEGRWKPSVELRPIVRSFENTDIKLKKSLNLWDLNKEESMDYLRDFLKFMNGQPVCLYYSIFNFDNSRTDKSNITKRGKIVSEAAVATQEIVLDFDDTDFDGYIELVDHFEALGIYALWVFTGHGYQAHILLDEETEDTQILLKAVSKFRSKGFMCDAKCVDPARVMRLPYTFNCKCFVDDAYINERENPPKCMIVQDTDERYSIYDIYEKLDTLETINPEDEKIFFDALRGNNPEVVDDSDELVIHDGVLKYPHLERFTLPDAMEKMLRHTKKGYRNKVLGFLIQQFKMQYKLSKEAIYETLELWSVRACVPRYDKQEFDNDFRRLYYNYNGLSYDASLAQEFGTIDFNDMIRLRKKDITIPNQFFQAFPDLTDKEVKVYLAICMLEHKEKDTTQASIAEFLNLSDRAVRNALKPLIKSGHVYVEKGNRTLGEQNSYHTSKIVRKSEGYQIYSYNDLYAYIGELCAGPRATGELKLFLFMRYKFYSQEIYMTQEKLGTHTGISRRSVSDVVQKLDEKGFLKVKKTRKGGIREFCEYTLLR